ncbi:MAG TPA: hypothetical protein VK968_01915, partial [Roseimicrobium sp.]|nr:hypothetical protein [Roseimicrobium sp.]
MKTGTIIGLSLAANIGLAAFVVHLVRQRPAAVPPTAPLTTKSLKTALLATKSGTSTNTASGGKPAEPFKWGQLEAEDYKVYIERLRAIGCPEQTIRDIIIADLDKLYAPTLQQLQKRRESLSFWNSEEEEVLNEVDADATAKAQRDADLEKRRILKELLGADLVAERLRMRGQWDYYERRLSFLPEEKRVDIRDISERFIDETFAIKAKQWDDGTPLTP